MRGVSAIKKIELIPMVDLVVASIIVGGVNYLLFHSLIELYSIIIAFSIGIIALNTRQIYKSDFFIFLGIAYVFIGAFDLIHTLTYKGMGVFPSYGVNLPTQFWIIARYVEAISLVSALYFLKNNLKFKLTALVYSGGSLVLLLSVFMGFFPNCLLEGSGLTVFKIISEYIISAILFVAIVFLYQRKDVIDRTVFKYTLASYITAIISEICFTIYVDVYDILNLTGHIFKSFSFYFLYKAMIETTLTKPYNLLFFRLKSYTDRLDQKAQELEETNLRLKREMAERAETESALLEREKFIRAVLGSLNANIVVLDRAGRIITTNESWVSFGKENGYAGDDHGKNYLDICLQAFMSGDKMAFEALRGLERVLYENHPIFTLEYPCHAPTEQRWFLMQVTPLNSVGGGVVVSHLDITLRKKAEEKLRKLSRAVEQSPSTVVITDLDGNIEYVNPKFTEATGYTYEEAIGKNPRILKSDVHDDAIYKELWETITAGQEWRGEVCNKKKNGELYWEFASISPIKDEHGENTHYIGIKEDITERKLMREKLFEAKQAAERANQAKSEFLAKMSHEIRTPMNGIIGLTELLLKMNQDVKIQRYLAMIDHSAKLLLEIINDILDFSRIEAGKLELEQELFNLKDLVEHTCETYTVKAQQKGIELVYDLEPVIPQIVLGDQVRLKQVILNLLGNAIKFTEKGHIYLEVIPVEISSANIRLQFSVTDTGMGIPQEDFDQIFESFGQSNNKVSRMVGTGLGLAIARQLVYLMDGDIWVESELGTGSTFSFTACFGVKENVEIVEDKILRTQDETQPKIALIVKNKVMREVLNRRLKYWRCNVEEHPVFDEDFDVLIFDVDLEGQMLEQLHLWLNHDPAVANQCILLRSVTDSSSDGLLQKYKIKAELFKPVKMSDLYAEINEILHPQEVTVEEEQRSSSDVEVVKTSIPLHILLAEDNYINQQLAITILRNMNWTVDVVDNGYDVIKAWENQQYDIILMDIKMPELDGLATTKIIRQKEGEKNGHIPIIAMTAYAMREDQERALNAGMDAHIAKPIRAEELYEKIYALTDSRQEMRAEVAVNLAQALNRLDGNKDLMQRLVKILLKTYPEQLKSIEEAIATQAVTQLENLAHSFRGAVSNFAVDEAYHLANTLESLAREGRFNEAREVYERLKKVMDQVEEYFNELKWDEV